MSERRTGSSNKEKGKTSYGDPSEYESDQSQLDSEWDDLPSYNEALQDGRTTKDHRVNKKYPNVKRPAHVARSRETREQEPPCSHWSESECLITVKSRKCCACMDQRPETKSGKYPMYVDGEGWVESATRWQYYCPNCQKYFDPEAKAKFLLDQRVWADKRAKSLADERDERDRRYFGIGRWIEAVKSHMSG
ncbi:hypothetical protein Hte_012125 [Hypoxylon texense]